MSEEILIYTLFDCDANGVRKLAKKVDVSPKGSKLDIINRIKTGLDKSDVKFHNIFKKCWNFLMIGLLLCVHMA